MKPKTTVLMVLAIGCGGAAAFMTNKLIAERNKPAEDVKKVTVLVVKAGTKKIPAMTFIKKPLEDTFELQEKNEADVPKNALTALDDKDIKDGFRVSRSFAEGTVLSRDDVITKESEGIAAKLPAGYRAVAVRVTAESLAGGFVLPGSKVDVIWTFRTTNSEIGTLTILQNTVVLAVDTTSARNPENPQTILGATATLALKPEDVQKISLASGNGDLRLSIRPVGDDTKIQLSGTKVTDLAKQTSDSGDEKTETDPKEHSTTPTAVVPPLPTVPPTMMPTPETKPAPAVVVAEQPKPKVIHVLKVQDGPNEQSHQFIFNEETQSFEGSPVKKKDVK